MKSGVFVFFLLALVSVCSAAYDGRCCRRTFKVVQDAYEAVKIEQRTVNAQVSQNSGLEGSQGGTERAKAGIAQLKQLLTSNSSNGVTNIQEGPLNVYTNSDYRCDNNGNNCQSINTGYTSTITLSFNAPIPTIDALSPQIYAINGAEISYQSDYVLPEIFGAAQNSAIKRALTYAKYRAEQTVSGLGDDSKIGQPLEVVTSSDNYLQSGGGANSAVRGNVEVTYELL